MSLCNFTKQASEQRERNSKETGGGKLLLSKFHVDIMYNAVVFCNMIDISALNAFVIFINLNFLWNYTKNGMGRIRVMTKGNFSLRSSGKQKQ